MAVPPTSAYAATDADLRMLTREELALRSQLEAAINHRPVKDGYSRCFHSTDMKAAFNIVATGLRPSQLYNQQLGGRRNHNAGAFVTKVSPLTFGFPGQGWLKNLLNNNYGKDVEDNHSKNDWVTERGEVCLVLDLPDKVLVDAASEDPAYAAEGRNVFYVPIGGTELQPELIVFAFWTTLRKPSSGEADILRKRFEEALERDFFEAEWLARLAASSEEAAQRRLEAAWSQRCERAAWRLRPPWWWPYWSRAAVQKVRQALLDRSTSLDLSDEKWGCDETRAVALLMEALRPHSSLQKLCLRWSGIGPLGAGELAKALAHNGSLRRLELCYNHVGSEGALKLREALQHNSTLQELDLGSNEIGHQGTAALGEALRQNTALQALNLGGNEIGDQGATALGEALQRNTALQTLYLGHNGIGHQGAVALGQALQRNTVLRTLDLGVNSIGDQGAAALGEALQCNTALHTLSLWSNSIGDQGAAALGPALRRNTALQALELRLNSIGNHGAAAMTGALQHNTSLRTLGLGLNPISEEAKAALRAALERTP